ncbi:MAG TPA: ADP-forming succinate--CoA ligase subunit beta [Symbiobacteriaceae bacterium]|jgi:succinyl-CoA synthetase beta subunit
MKLYEYLAKRMMAEHGVPTGGGILCETPEQAEEAARKIGPCAIKAQVLVGGRGKAGGIKLANTPEEAKVRASEILGMNLKGFTVDKVLVDPQIKIEKEFYVSITLDGLVKLPLIMASAFGGVEIESVAHENIVFSHVDITTGLLPYQTREIARKIGLTGDLAKQFGKVLIGMYNAFRKYDAELVEINPLALTENGTKLVAADGRFNVEDDALFRHPEFPTVEEGTELEQKVKKIGLAFVQLDGDIAVMANGAGMAMGTLDVLSAYGGRPANFLDAGGGSGVEPTAQAFDALLGTKPKGIFVNIFGGITRCDLVAEAIIQVKKSKGIDVPLVVRMVGTNDVRGREMLAENGIEAYTEMGEAARAAVKAAYGKEA